MAPFAVSFIVTFTALRALEGRPVMVAVAIGTLAPLKTLSVSASSQRYFSVSEDTVLSPIEVMARVCANAASDLLAKGLFQ